jgi:hypothetical protein
MFDVPSTKVNAAVLAGAVVTILTFLVEVFSDVELTAGVAAAITTVLVGLFGFVVKETNPSPSAVAAIQDKVDTGELSPIVPDTRMAQYPPNRDLLAEEQAVYDAERGQDPRP